MTVLEAINSRRAYRSLAPIEVNENLIRDLTRSAQLAPTCFNNQPARFVFVYDPKTLEQLKPAFSKGNEWCYAASIVVAVFAEKEADCIIHDREYYLFDTGMQTAFLILRATELGLVAHPIAGYSPKKVREVLNIPERFNIITLILIGKHADTISPVLSEKQVEWEKTRPERLPQDKVLFFNRYTGD
ncbi:nitroreductase family protein [candidate division WOR-3 bacterium]|nr:nitroreductase family protein [candidate division WOR-3 bacterium]